MTSLSVNAGTDNDIASIKSRLETRTPPIKAKSIKPSPIPGLYEVFIQGNIIYTDNQYSYVIVNGSMIDTKSEMNLTDQNYKLLTTIKFGDLPLQNAIEIRKGAGTYKFAVFSDPDCPYCKMLENNLAEANLTDYTAYIFLYPLKNLHPEAAEKSESIWCAKDKSQVWTNFMVKGSNLEKASCDNPLSANELLAEELGVGGTPTIYLNNGQLTQDPQELIEAIQSKK